MMNRLTFVLLALLIFWSNSNTAQGEPSNQSKIIGQWTKKEAWAWHNKQPWLVGCNYLPAYAGNPIEMWQADTFDAKAIEKELKLAEDLGFNLIRVFLHDMLWQQDSKDFIKRLEQFLVIADKHHLKVMPVLFDACWNPKPALGKQPEPIPHRHNSTWSQSPHIDTLGKPEQWDGIKSYAQGIVKYFRNDNRILIWDVYNEPGNPNTAAYAKVELKNKEVYAAKLLKQSFQWVREVKPTQPLTASVWVGEWGIDKNKPDLNRIALTHSDLNQFHSYLNEAGFLGHIAKVKAYGRPIICGEYMARTVGCTFEMALPIMKKEKITALSWGLVAGRSQTNYPWETWDKPFTAEPETWFHDIFRQDGTPFNAKEVKFIKQIISSANAQSTDSSIVVTEKKAPISAPSWKSINVDNGLVSMRIVPGIGGRVMQYQLGDYGFFWVNTKLDGVEPPKSKLTEDDGWLNYGGDKLWPSPQGWNNPGQWPGPPDAVLDGGPYKFNMQKNAKSVSLSLTSEEDKVSGIQFSRDIKMFEGTTRISVDAHMKNMGNKPRQWGIWGHTQLDASNRKKEAGYNHHYWGYCPLNSKSMHPKGYHVMFGRKNNPSYTTKDGIVGVHYQREVGKIGVDSDAGWVATVDGTAGKVFVQRFKFQPNKKYPNDASVEFWMNGLGEINAYNKTIKMPEDEASNPHVFESEVVGPFVKLAPGESTTLHYDWYSADIGGNYPVIDCTEAGVVCEALTAAVKNRQLSISGRFGVFTKGEAQLVILGKDQQSELAVQTIKNISPLKALHINLTLKNEELLSAGSIELRIVDGHSKSIRILAKAKVSK